MVGAALVAALWYAFKRINIGAKIRAVVDNRRMAQSVGIDVDLLFTLTFAVGSGLAALGGGLAIQLLGLTPSFAIVYLVFFLLVVAVGGSGSVWGTLASALVLGVSDTAGKYLFADAGEIFPSLTLKENLEVALRPGSWTIGAVFELFPRLRERQANRGNHFSGGEQQMLAIACALVGNPAVLLMDEPSEGLAPVIVEELTRAMRLLVEAHSSDPLVRRRCAAALCICLNDRFSKGLLKLKKTCENTVEIGNRRGTRLSVLLSLC